MEETLRPVVKLSCSIVSVDTSVNKTRYLSLLSTTTERECKMWDDLNCACIHELRTTCMYILGKVVFIVLTGLNQGRHQR